MSGGSVLLLAHSETGYHWSLDPDTLLPVLLMIALYVVGMRRLSRHRRIPRRDIGLFVGAVILLFAAVASPLHALSHTLFAAHMAQHLILLVVVPPLLIASRAMLPLLWGLPLPLRRGGLGLLRRTHSPLLTLVLHTGIVWLWHLPALYNATLRDSGVHALEHASFLLVALLYWWVLIYPPRLNYGSSLFSAFFTMMQCSLLGLLMTFASHPWYSVHHGGLGLSALEDQQLAGVLMWLPASVVYLLAALLLLARWLERMEQRQRTLSRLISPVSPSPLDEGS